MNSSRPSLFYCLILAITLSLLPLLTTSTVLAKPLQQDDSARLKSLKEAYQQVLKEIQEANSKRDTATVVQLIGRMQSLNLSITDLKMKMDGKKDPYMEMDITTLNKEMKRLQKEATSTGDTALWTKYGKVAKAYNYKILRASSGKMTGALKRNDGSDSSKLEYFSIIEAFRWIANGDIERGFNGLEAILEGGLNSLSTGSAITLAQMYFDFFNDASRALKLACEVEMLCLDKLGTGPLDFNDEDVKLWLNYLYGARNAKARFFLSLEKEKELDDLIMTYNDSWSSQKKEFLKTCSTPFALKDMSFLFAGTFTRGGLLAFGADLSDKNGNKNKTKRYRNKALTVFKGLLALFDNIREDQKMFLDGWRLATQRRIARITLLQEGPEAGLNAYDKYVKLETKYFASNNMTPTGHFYIACLIERANILSSLDRLNEALELVQLAEDSLTVKGETSDRAYRLSLSWKPSYVAGTICEKTGKLKDAISHYRRAIETIEKLYEKMRSGQLKGQFLKGEECSESYRRLIKLLIDQKRYNEAFEYLERSKSAVLLDMLKSLPLRERKNWPKELLKREQEIKKRIKEQKKGSEKLRNSRWDYEILLRNIASHMANLAPQEDGGSFDKVWYTKAKVLLSKMENDPQAVLCEYFDSGDYIYCFVIKSSKLKCYPCGSSKKVRKLSRKLRRYISSRSSRWKKSAVNLYTKLIAPWEESLTDCRKLIIVPTGFLHSLPFASLINGDGELLMKASPISVISQASLLTTVSRKENKGTGCLVLADPDGSLPNARTEAENIKKIQTKNNRCQIKMGENANEGWLKKEMGFTPDSTTRPAILHLATHGLFEKGMNLFSSLVLSESAYEDGALTVGEIFNELDLRHTPVVVLSACNTALGDQDGGDEIVGLSRAFQYAGARWVIASLWEVSDEASAKLMQLFHEELGKTENASVALRNAQIRIRETKEWEHPFYWAAFVAYKR